MYFKLNPEARWSDGVPVTAGDFAFTLEFMRSKHIIAPWYNDYYTQEIDRVIVYDDHTLAVVSTKAVPDLHLKLGIQPTPRHFYETLDEGFVRKYNWEIVPNTGAYQISDFSKGKYVMFKRKQDWWGDRLHYFQHRFNVDRVKFTVVRDINVMWEYFKKAQVDTFAMNFPQYWHIRSKTPQIENGYIERIWFFNDTQQSAMGLWLNQDREIFKDPRLRFAFAHAMNVEKVIEQVLRNDYFRLESGFVGYGPYSNTEIRARRFDLGKVDEYMKAAGWRRGRDGIWEKGRKPLLGGGLLQHRGAHAPAGGPEGRGQEGRHRAAAPAARPLGRLQEGHGEEARRGLDGLEHLPPAPVLGAFPLHQRPQAPDQQHHQHGRPRDGPADRRLPEQPR